jgi:hypothetical protein
MKRTYSQIDMDERRKIEPWRTAGIIDATELRRYLPTSATGNVADEGRQSVCRLPHRQPATTPSQRRPFVVPHADA